MTQTLHFPLRYGAPHPSGGHYDQDSVFGLNWVDESRAQVEEPRQIFLTIVNQVRNKVWAEAYTNKILPHHLQWSCRSWGWRVLVTGLAMTITYYADLFEELDIKTNFAHVETSNQPSNPMYWTFRGCLWSHQCLARFIVFPTILVLQKDGNSLTRWFREFRLSTHHTSVLDAGLIYTEREIDSWWKTRGRLFPLDNFE